MRRAIRKHLRDFIAMVALVLLAVGIAGYVLSEQRFRFPLVEEEPFRLVAELPDAQAVTPGQGQTIRTAGVEIGQIGKVEVEDGVAVVELQLERRYAGLVRADATALLRSKTGLKDMFIEVDPGEGRPLREGERLSVRGALPDVDPDEILSALDRDARDYLKLLIAGAGKGLRSRGGDLRGTLRRFEPLHRDLARVTRAIARRRANLRRLVHNYSRLVEELAGKDRELVRLVGASNQVLEAFASEDQNISRFVSRLPGTLRTTRSTLVKVDRLGRVLGPSLESLRPAVRELDEANRAVLPLAREGAPIVRRQVRPFARAGQPFIRDFGAGGRDLAAAAPDLTAAFRGLNRLFNIGAHNPNGREGLTGDLAKDRARDEGYLYWLAWTAQNTNSLFSTSDAQGPFRRAFVGGLNCDVFRSSGLPGPVVDELGAAGVCAP